jgi:preprotein translocase subunit SecA
VEELQQDLTSDQNSFQGIETNRRQVEKFLLSHVLLEISLPEMKDETQEYTPEELYDLFLYKLAEIYIKKQKNLGEQSGDIERWSLLKTTDQFWREHLMVLDQLKEGISLRGYGQKDPLQEYKREAFELFSRLIKAIKEETILQVLGIEPQRADFDPNLALDEALEELKTQLQQAKRLMS